MITINYLLAPCCYGKYKGLCLLRTKHMSTLECPKIGLRTVRYSKSHSACKQFYIFRKNKVPSVWDCLG